MICTYIRGVFNDVQSNHDVHSNNDSRAACEAAAARLAAAQAAQREAEAKRRVPLGERGRALRVIEIGFRSLERLEELVRGLRMP